MATSGVEVEWLSSSIVLEASFGSTKIDPFLGLTNEGLVDAGLNASDNSSAPRIDWDTMVDNCEER